MQYVFVHGLGLSGSIWSRIIPLLDGEIITVNLPGHADSNSTNYGWDAIYEVILEHIEYSQWSQTTLILHSFSAAVIPEIVFDGVTPFRVFMIEGILHSSDSTWTTELAQMDDLHFNRWLPRFRAVAEITLRSQLIVKCGQTDINEWANGLRTVNGHALRTMASNLKIRLDSEIIAQTIRSARFSIRYIRGGRSRLSSSGRVFIEQLPIVLDEIDQSGHFPMIDNPVQLKNLLSK